MELIVLFAASAAMAWLFGRAMGRAQHARVHKLLGTMSETTEIALGVARHEAESRRQVLAPIHLLYGLLQDEAFTATLRTLGGDPDKLEDAALAALDTLVQPATLAQQDSPDNAAFAVMIARLYARYHGRPTTNADLWHAIAKTDAARLVEGNGVALDKLAFALVHGDRAPASTLAGETRVAIVLRNDDYTTAEFVVAILRDIFELPEADANAIMLAVHREGHGHVGSFDSLVAKTKVEAVWARARAERHPLWCSVEIV